MKPLGPLLDRRRAFALCRTRQGVRTMLDFIEGAVSALAGSIFWFLPSWLQVFVLLLVVVISGEIVAHLIGFVGRLLQVAVLVFVGLAFLRLIGA